jgi:two-component system NtrC family sensor kinase
LPDCSGVGIELEIRQLGKFSPIDHATPGKSMNRESKPLSPYYRSLRRNMVLLVMVISVTPMLLVTGIILNQFSASHHEKINAHLGELVLKHKQNIDSFLSEKLHNIRFLADTIDFDNCGHQDMIVEGIWHRLQRAYGPVFVDLGVIDGQGQQVAYAGPVPAGKAPAMPMPTGLKKPSRATISPATYF